MRSRCATRANTGAGSTAARPALDRFLDAELARYRLAPDRLVLVGFSQGTMMALHVGLRRAAAPAGIVAYSGLLAGPEHLAETTARPPVLLIHGEADDMIPVEALHMAREALAAARACRSNGTCARASATASTRKGNGWPAHFIAAGAAQVEPHSRIGRDRIRAYPASELGPDFTSPTQMASMAPLRTRQALIRQENAYRTVSP